MYSLNNENSRQLTYDVVIKIVMTPKKVEILHECHINDHEISHIVCVFYKTIWFYLSTFYNFHLNISNTFSILKYL